MPAETEISALILTRERPVLLSECLGSFLDSPPSETIVGVNGGDPALSLPADLPAGVRVIVLPEMCRGEARNALAAAASSRWLCFLDDDVVLPAGYFGRLRGLIERSPGFSVFGGGQRLHPSAGYFETAVYWLLASRWGSGPFTARFSPARGERESGPEEFILCNLTVDSGFLREAGLAFEGHLSSAEENLLLNRMEEAGARMKISADLDLVHRRRACFAGFVRQVFVSARGRGQATAHSSSAFCAFTLLPPAALVAAAAAAVFAPAALAAVSAFYAAACLSAAAVSPAPARIKAALPPLYAALHLAYAAGWLYGFIERSAEKTGQGPAPRRCGCQGKS